MKCQFIPIHTLQCQGTINDTMASVHGLEQDGQQEGSNRGRISSVETIIGGTMRRGTGGQHLLDIEEEALTGTTVTVR